MNIYYMFMIFVGVSLISLIAIAIIACRIYAEHQKKLERLSRYSININAVIDETIPEILEAFISSEFDTYQAKNLVAEGLDDGYITEEQEKKIIDEMVDICSRRLSPAMVDKLSLFWRPESIGSVIADQIYLHVVSFRSQRNSTVYYDEKENTSV